MTKAIDPASTPLSEEETRAILTPFAFKIDKSLFGLSLAKPWKRGVALLIDLLIIAVLSDAPGELLAIVIAITLYRLGGKKRAQQQGKIKGAKRRAVLRGLGIFIVFVMLLDTLPSMFNSSNKEDLITKNASDINISDPKLVAIVAKKLVTLIQSDCNNLSCWEKELSDIPNLLNSVADQKIQTQDAVVAIQQLVELTELNKEDQQYLASNILKQYQQLKAQQQIEPNVSSDNKVIIVEQEPLTIPQPVKEQKPIYSVKKLIKGIIDDLGLGFGWAAFYFTIFTALWHGQTLGKKLLKIKVLQLDGTPLTLMDSFGRYGGYGAGIATGLLGFIQIYWDPNRQAIHDKISATVVVNVNASNKVNMTQKSE
ncbi:MAG: hypothetical protein COB35_07335 [Gammaproteobacteria bacterium]|nr:MAG: hypothetical protein COB35_07335 [Gammaproteobacteria bacterium]